MGIESNLLDRFGFIGAAVRKIVSPKSVLRLVEPWIRKPSVRVPRVWPSLSSQREFQRRELARRAFNESLARLHVAR